MPIDNKPSKTYKTFEIVRNAIINIQNGKVEQAYKDLAKAMPDVALDALKDSIKSFTFSASDSQLKQIAAYVNFEGTDVLHTHQNRSEESVGQNTYRVWVVTYLPSDKQWVVWAQNKQEVETWLRSIGIIPVDNIVIQQMTMPSVGVKVIMDEVLLPSYRTSRIRSEEDKKDPYKLWLIEDSRYRRSYLIWARNITQVSGWCDSHNLRDPEDLHFTQLTTVSNPPENDPMLIIDWSTE